MEFNRGNKLIVAVIKFGDYDDTAEELTRNGFFVTLLSSTGGFLKKRNATIMVGVSDDKVEQVLGIIKAKAGHRQETVYINIPQADGVGTPGGVPAASTIRDVGGAVAFVMTLDHMGKF